MPNLFRGLYVPERDQTVVEIDTQEEERIALLYAGTSKQ